MQDGYRKLEPLFYTEGQAFRTLVRGFLEIIMPRPISSSGKS